MALIRKNKAKVILKTGRFNTIDSTVIIRSVRKAVWNCMYMTCAVETCSSLSYFVPYLYSNVFIMLLFSVAEYVDDFRCFFLAISMEYELQTRFWEEKEI